MTKKDDEKPDSKITILEEFFGPSYKDFKLEDGLYKPSYYTKEHKQLLLDDYGLGYSASCKFFFGKSFSIEEIKMLLQPYSKDNILKAITRLARHIDLEGLSRISDDEIQKDILNHAFQKAKAFGLSLTLLDEYEVKSASLLTHQTVDSLIAIILSLGLDSDGGITIDQDPQGFSLAILAINDHVVGPTNKVEKDDPFFHYENLRYIWFNGPLVGSASEFMRRVHRLVGITRETVKLDLTGKVDKYFKQHFGVSLQEFHNLIPAIHTSWLADKSISELSTLNCNPPDKPAHIILNDYLATICLTPQQYTDEIRKLETAKGERFVVDTSLYLLLIQKPFLKIEEGMYLLLAPHLLLRNGELAIIDGFLSKKADGSGAKGTTGDKITDLYGPMGQAAEAYGRRLIEICVKKYRSEGEVDGLFQDGQKEDVGDYTILHPRISVVFEQKNKQPAFNKAFAPTSKGLDEFKKWFHETYLRSRDEAKAADGRATPGALHQLDRDCKKVLAGKVGGLKPLWVLPVLINPQNLIFAYDFYAIINSELKKQDLLTNRNILPPVVLGLGDLEYIYGLNLAEKGMSLRQILIEKGRKESGRLTSWGKVLKELGFEYNQPEEFSTTLRELMSRAVEFLKLEGR
jgi:hypothetical protein